MTVWYFAHITGYVLWVGGGIAAMLIGIRGRAEDRATQGVIVRMLAGIHRLVMLPGIVLTIVSGAVLSVPAARAAAPTAWLMLMQGTGIVAGLMVLFVSLPALSRLERLAPTGDSAPRFDALRRRQAMSGMVAGILGALALLGGILHKY